MIAGLALKLVGLGVPARAARPVAIALAITAALTLGFATWRTWLFFHDRAVVANYEQAVTAEVKGRELGAERAAHAEDVRIERRNRARSERLERTIDHAVTVYPSESARPVGPATASVLDSLRADGELEAGDPSGGAGEAPDREGGAAGDPAGDNAL